jgi:hypothetical protein
LEKLKLTRMKMDMHVRDSLIEGYQELINDVTLPDPNDRHVLAAAIKSNAQVIVTYNLGDFPKICIEKYEIEAQHPDNFIRTLLDISPAKIIQKIKETRMSLKSPSKRPEEYLAILEQQALPRTVEYLRDYIESI